MSIDPGPRTSTPPALRASIRALDGRGQMLALSMLAANAMNADDMRQFDVADFMRQCIVLVKDIGHPLDTESETREMTSARKKNGNGK